MSYNVGILWGVYLVVLIISFIIIYFVMSSAQKYDQSIDIASAFFLATLLGAIAVFIGAIWLNTAQLSDSEQIALSVLFIVAFLLPIFTILYIVYVGNKECLPECTDPCKTPCPKSYNKKYIHCDGDTGLCHLEKEEIYEGDNVTTVIYSSNPPPTISYVDPNTSPVPISIIKSENIF